MVLRVLILNIICFYTIGILGQETTQVKAEMLYQKAYQLLQEGKDEKARIWFTKCLEEDPNYTDALLQLGELAFNRKEWDLARSYFIRATNKDPARSPTAWFRLGTIGWQIMDYNLVRDACTNYLDLNPNDRQRAQRAGKYLRDANFCLSMERKDSGKILNPLNENINTVDDEYFPSLSADGQRLVFTRRLNGQEDLVVSQLKDGVWSPVTSPNTINTGNNEGAHSISFDGKVLLFTACNRPHGLGRCDIYVSSLERENWSHPVNIGPPVNSSFWEAQPALSPDGRTLFFSSDRPDGSGGKDLYCAYWLEGKWTEPINLGTTINTPYDEQAPFMHADGETFYFISEGHPGMGGSDIFMSKKHASGWTIPLNIGYPINSRADESRLHLSMDGKTGLLARENETQSDIYQVELNPNVRAIPSTYARINVVSANDMKRIQANLEIYELKEGTKAFRQTNVNEEIFICLPASKDYGLHISKAGYTFYSQSFMLSDTHTFLEPYEILAELIPVKMEEVVQPTKIQLQNIFFQFGKSDLLPESKIELDLLTNFMEENPEVKIKVNGHTDNIGSQESNLALSMDRAYAVVKYLIDQGIDKDRLQAEGLGDSHPVTTNETEEGRRQNRRTEFEIINPR